LIYDNNTLLLDVDVDELGWKPAYGFEEVARLLDARIPEVLPEQAAESAISE
jgi:hypothetical protein